MTSTNKNEKEETMTRKTLYLKQSKINALHQYYLQNNETFNLSDIVRDLIEKKLRSLTEDDENE